MSNLPENNSGSREDKILSILSMTKKAGSISIGEEQTGFTARSGKSRVIILASDASDNAYRRAKGFADNAQVPLVKLPCTKASISAATGKAGCSMAAITDLGLADSLLQALRDYDPEEYGETAQIIREKYERLRKRKSKRKSPDNKGLTAKRRTNI